MAAAVSAPSTLRLVSLPEGFSLANQPLPTAPIGQRHVGPKPGSGSCAAGPLKARVEQNWTAKPPHCWRIADRRAVVAQRVGALRTRPKRTNTALPFIPEVNRRVQRRASSVGCASHTQATRYRCWDHSRVDV